MKPRGCRAYAGLLLGLTLLAWLALGARVPWLQGAAYSDYIVAHAPQVAFVRRAVAAWGRVPLWSPVYNAGYPLYANPLAAPAYPPGWVAYLLPVPWGLNLALLLHFAWAALGWGCWARGKGLRGWPWFGLVAALLPKTLAHGLAGHVTLLYAVAWIPWLLRSLEAGPWPRAWGTGLVLGLITLADPRAAALALPVLGVASWPGRAAWRAWWKDGLRWGLTAGLVAAPLLLPLAVFVFHSPRQGMDFATRTAFSLPWGLLPDLGLAYPRTPSVEYRVYLPWAVSLLALRSAWQGRGRRGLVLAGLGLALALGRSGPLGALWYVPGWSWLRVPARFGWVLAWGFLWAATRAETAPAPLGKGYRRVWLLLGALGLALRGLAWPLLLGVHGLSFGYALALAADAAAWWQTRPGARPGRALWPLALAAALAFAGHQAEFRPLARLEVADAQRAAYAQHLLGTAGQPWRAHWRGPRVYSPSYSIGQWSAARVGLPLAYGVDPLYTAAWAQWLYAASRVPAPVYTVTLPPLEGSDPATANAAYRADAQALAEARVGALVAAFPHDGEGWQPRGRVAGAWVYTTAQPCPLAWVEPPARADCRAARPAQVRIWTPNRIVLDAQGPGRLVLNEAAYPTWQVRVDGQPAAADAGRAPWRAVRLSPGVHRVEWVLRPWDAWLGWALALSTLAYMLRIRARPFSRR